MSRKSSHNRVVDVKSKHAEKVVKHLEKAFVVEVQRDTIEVFEEIVKNSKDWTPGQSAMTEADHLAVVERLRNNRK